MQQATQQNLPTNDNQLVMSDTTDPQTTVPIFYIHAGDAPFCSNLRCFCQRGKRAGATLYSDIAAGKLLLAQVKTGGTITQPVVQSASTLLDEDTPDCQYYGHSWELTELPNVKECVICHVRGFCPGCTPQPPRGTRPFYCTCHAGRGEQ